jgi:tetratricopeptide (TPR) repeat protein
MIQEVDIAQLDHRLIKQLEAADRAAFTDIAYTTEIYSSILKQSPGCLELRQKLRKLQFKQEANSGKSLTGIFGKVTIAPFLLRGKSDENPTLTLGKAENLITKSPSNVVAHQMLAGAAKTLGLLKTTAFAYETIKKIQPKDLANLKNLANIYIETGQTEEAIETGNLIVRINPRDGEAEDIMKRASVAAAMQRGKWEQSEDFRTQLKDETEAQALEQASKTMTDAKGLEGLIRQAYEKVQQEPNNISHYKQLSDYYQRYGDLENAIAWIQQARAQEAGKGDVSLEEKERSLTLEYFDHSIDQWEKACAQDPENKDWAKSLVTANANKKQYQFTQLKSLVERYPNDYGYRYELGLFLFQDGKFDECLQHFQLAQRNAKVRLDAILYLGRSYSRKGFHDMAIEQFSILKSEIQVMDDRKKDATYELGCCHEAMGNKDKAFEEFKSVYSADISFRDVADKINTFYQTKTAT